MGRGGAERCVGAPVAGANKGDGPWDGSRRVKAVVYSRFSTSDQADNGTSLETQARACVDHARANGWEVARCVRDSVSGATLDRPGLNEALTMLRAGEAGVLVAYAVDRLARDQIKLAVLVDQIYE